jgi:hypothetical protein
VVLLHVAVPEDGGEELLQRHADGDGPAAANDQDPILPNMIFPILHIFVRFSFKYVQNFLQMFTNICKPNSAHFASILQKIDSK